MRYLKLLFLVILTNAAFAKNGLQYKVDFNPPQSMQWTLAHDAQDAGGYSQIYFPSASASTHDQSIHINYGQNIKSSLQDSMQEVINVMANSGCEQTGSLVIQQQDNFLIFATSMNKCANGKALKQLFKVFNMSDGQYSIVYAADPTTVSSTTIQQMESVIISARIVPNK